MKKLMICVLLATVLLAGCTIYVTTPSRPGPSQSIEKPATKTPQPSVTQSQEAVQTTETASSALPVVTKTKMDYAPQYGRFEAYVPVISGLLDEGLQQAVNEYFYDDVQAAGMDLDDMAAQDEERRDLYYLEADFTVTRNDGTLLSIRETVNAYSGGATDSVFSVYFNILNTKPGIELSLGDLFLPGANYTAIINGEIGNMIQNAPEMFADVDFITINEDQHFYLTDTEITIVFDKYEIAPGAAGEVEFKISFDRLSDFTNNWLN